MHKTSSSQQFVYSATIEGSPAKPWACCAGGWAEVGWVAACPPAPLTAAWQLPRQPVTSSPLVLPPFCTVP